MRFLTTGLGLAVSVAGVQADWALYNSEDWFDVTTSLRVAGGASSGELEELAVHGHDPNRDFTVQGLEFGGNLRLNDHVQGLVALNVFRDLEDDLTTELEEAFIKLADLPGGFELRGGRYLNRFGTQNAVHLHGWEFVDSNLVSPGFLGDHGLVTEGLELSWFWEGPVTSAFSFSFGDSVEIGGEHGHGEEEEEHEEGEEEGEHDEHGHGGAEEAVFEGDTLTGRWLVRWNYNDFHRHDFGLNFAMGENGYGRDSQVYSADYYYTYRSNGFEPGGRFFKVGAEVLYRQVEWQEDEEGVIEQGDADQWGLVATASYGFGDGWEAALRYDWIQGVESGPDPDEVIFEMEERKRLTAALSKRIAIADDFTALVRLQGNFDELPEGEEQSVFLQVGFDWGGPEVR